MTSDLSAEDIARFGDKPAEAFAANMQAVKDRIAAACLRCGRQSGDVRLLPVTKTVPAHILRHAFAAGITDFGENKLQEARNKQEVLADLAIAGLVANRDKMLYLVDKNPILVTALNPVIGYDKAAQAAKKAYAEGRTVKEVVVELGFLDEAEATRLLDARPMTGD